MIRVSLDGIAREVNPAEFIALLPPLAQNTCIVARSLYKCYQTGAFEKCAEIRRYFLTPDEFQALKNVIRHTELKLYIDLLEVKVNTLLWDDDQIAEMLSPSSSPFTPGVNSKAPPRAPLTGWRQEVRIRILEMQEIQLVIEKWVSWLTLNLSATPNENPGVQENVTLEFKTPFTLPDLPGKKPLKVNSLKKFHPTPDHLIDQGLEESDARKAIKLYKQALRYEKTGVLASKAYLGLGMSYEDLGDDKNAIKHYTLSLENLSNAYAWLWRGQAHFRLGHFAEAQSDLEQAIQLGLPDQELEQAQSYLNEIKKHQTE